MRFRARVSAGMLGALLSACHAAQPLEPEGAAGSNDGGAGGVSGEFAIELEEVELEGSPTLVTDFAFYPGDSNQFLTLSKDGQLRRYELGQSSAQLLGTWAVGGVHDEGDCGAMSLAFEPELAEAAFVYVGTCISNQGSAIVRLDLDAELGVVEGSEVTVIYVGHEQATRPWHNVGSIGFEPGGVLWALFGDKVQKGSARDGATNLGKLLRIVPLRTPGLGGYEPAPDNPQLPGVQSPDVYALGLRSPFRGSRDSQGRYWVGDVGGDLFEEVNVVEAAGQDFGWSDVEGPCSGCDTAPPLLYWSQAPDAAYVLDDPQASPTTARVAWVGPEVLPHEPDRYRGQLAGSVLFGDYCAGFMRHAKLDDAGVLTLDLPLGHLQNPSALRQHADGFVYAVTFGRCETTKDNAGDEAFSRLFRMVSQG